MINPMKSEYRAEKRKNITFILVFTLLALGSFFLTLGFGIYDISLSSSIQTFLDCLLGKEVDPSAYRYIWEVRTPRAIGAIVSGAALSVAGVVMQNNFRNPLAEPYTMGISSGAFLGAVLSIVSGIALIPVFSGDLALVSNAFVLSLVPTLIIIVATKFKKLTPTAMILLGIAVMYLFSSICQLILVTAPSESLADA